MLWTIMSLSPEPMSPLKKNKSKIENAWAFL